MLHIHYQIVKHAEGWAYKLGDVFSETFPSHDAALKAAREAAARQSVGGATQVCCNSANKVDLPAPDFPTSPIHSPAFTDNNFEGQFWYARALFIDNRASEAMSVFESLNDRAPSRFRTGASVVVEKAPGRKIFFDSTVKRKEEGYAFISLIDFPLDVFASRAGSLRTNWDQVRNGSQVTCNLAFSRRGPQIINVADRRA